MSATVDYSDTAKRGEVKIECIALAGRYVRHSCLNAKGNMTLDTSVIGAVFTPEKTRILDLYFRSMPQRDSHIWI